MPGGTGTTPFQITITDTTTSTSTNYPASGFFAILQPGLNANDSYTITVAEVIGSGLGPPSASEPIVTVSPTVTLVQNLGTGIRLQWQALTGFTQYVVAFQQHSGTSFTSVDVTSFTFGPATPGCIVGVAAQTSDGVSTGPTAAYTPILTAPILNRVRYDGTSLTYSWAPLDGFTTYQVSLSAGSGTPETQTSSGTTFTWPSALGTGPYTTWISAQDGVLVGPPSTVYPVILTAPTMSSVVYDGANLTLTWGALPGVSAYVAVLSRGSSSTSSEVATPRCVFNGPFTGTGYTTAAGGESSDGVSLGPTSIGYVPIFDAPTLTALGYDGTNLTPTWQQVSDPVSGYSVVVSNGVPEAFPAPNATTTSIPVALTAGDNYDVTVSAVNGIVTGPPSGSLTALTSPPATASLGYNGTSLIGSWSAPSQTVTGYVVELLAGGSSVETHNATASPQTFTTSVANGVVYEVQVRGTANSGAVTGPWATAPGPYFAALTYAYDSVGRVKSVEWAGTATEAFSYDTAGNVLTVTWTEA